MTRHKERLRLVRRVATDHFERVADWTTHVVGVPGTFAAAVLVIALWALSGPIFGFSDTWQLIINTGTTIVTFLLVVLNANSNTRAEKREHAHASRLDKMEREHGRMLEALHTMQVEQTQILRELKAARSRRTAKKEEAA